MICPIPQSFVTAGVGIQIWLTPKPGSVLKRDNMMDESIGLPTGVDASGLP